MAEENILLVEDDPGMRELIALTLKKETMKVTALEEGSKVISTLKAKNYDLVLLDLMLGKHYGFDILKDIRKISPALPVIIISGRNEEEKRITGFELDADDFINKPFSKSELVARVKRSIRRKIEYTGNPEQGEGIRLGSLFLDTKGHYLYKNDQKIELPAKEYRMLKFFMDHPGQLMTVEQICNHCWDDDFYDENAVRVYINKLRKVIEEIPRKPRLLKTAIGQGYRFEPSED